MLNLPPVCVGGNGAVRSIDTTHRVSAVSVGSVVMSEIVPSGATVMCADTMPVSERR